MDELNKEDKQIFLEAYLKFLETLTQYEPGECIDLIPAPGFRLDLHYD